MHRFRLLVNSHFSFSLAVPPGQTKLDSKGLRLGTVLLRVHCYELLVNFDFTMVLGGPPSGTESDQNVLCLGATMRRYAPINPAGKAKPTVEVVKADVSAENQPAVLAMNKTGTLASVALTFMFDLEAPAKLACRGVCDDVTRPSEKKAAAVPECAYTLKMM